ncbi:proline-rich transmembrane protein 1-like [Glandiceps talaboti]
MADGSEGLPGQPDQQQPPPYGQQPQQGYAQPQPGYGQPQQGYSNQTTTVVAAPQPMTMTTIVTKTAPSTYLFLAIFSMLCCFIPTGIVAVIFAAMVNGAWESGDEETARRYSSNAKCWSIASIVIGVVADILVVVIVVVYFVVIVGSAIKTAGDIADNAQAT